MNVQEIKKAPRPRYSGILVHPTSFPSPYGIGDLGDSAYAFIDFLYDARTDPVAVSAVRTDRFRRLALSGFFGVCRSTAAHQPGSAAEGRSS